MKLLVSHGAEVCCKDKKSYSPLHTAASSGMINVVKYLLHVGVDVSKLRPHTIRKHAVGDNKRASLYRSTNRTLMETPPCIWRVLTVRMLL